MDQIQAQPTISHLVQVYQPTVTNTKLQSQKMIHVTHASLPVTEEKITNNMDHIQPVQAIPHLVHVYQPQVSESKIQNQKIIHITQSSLPTAEEKITYQQTPKSLHLPLTHIPDIHMSQNHIVMSCQQSHLQNMQQQLHTQLTPQLLQNSDLGQSLHVILPQVPIFKQHMLVGEVQQQYYNHYDTCNKMDTKIESESQTEHNNIDKSVGCKIETYTDEVDNDIGIQPKRKRSLKPNPGSWACNVRKLKHQRGEAYINSRGKYVPERKVKTTKDCLHSCKYKCNERINDTDREHIFKAFYSLNANEKRHFLLNTTERLQIKHKSPDENHKRMHSFRYFFLVRAVRYTVCKNFYLGTLAISQKPIYNVHLGKSEMNIPKPDGRGLSEASTHALHSTVKDRVRKHIMSFSTEDSKPIKQFSKKKQFIDLNLSIKQMFNMYCDECTKDNVCPVKESMYRKILKEEFNLHFRKVKSEQQLCCKCKGVIKKKY
ncbi:hypothetical protein ACJJTC_006319 [Scirpophaga incertulas]